MVNQILESIRGQLNDLSKSSTSSNLIYRHGHSLYLNGQCTQLSASGNHFEFSVNDKYGDFLVKIDTGETLESSCECNTGQVCRHRAAALMQLHEMIKLDEDKLPPAGIKYTRSGMIKRVVEERKAKARHARYTIQYADNIFGEHLLTNERGILYKLTFRDLERKHGYCSCPDYRTNKLGTCKHLIFAFENIQKNDDFPPENLPKYPFIEVFLNPFRDYKISWFYPDKIFGEVAELFYRYFDNKKFIEDEEAEKLLGFFNNVEKHKQILVRPEVYEKVEKVSEQYALQRIEKSKKIDFSLIKTKLLPYQRQGVEFATFRKGAVIADEMGLGKTLQAIAVAVMKKEIFGFKNTLIICPAMLRNQWKKEIETYTGEQVRVIEGSPAERAELYQDTSAFFSIVNYETVVRDREIITKVPTDFIILDEAQRIRNYASLTSAVIKSIPRKHALVLTGTPIETGLIDLYSIILFVDPELLSPLWEFSYQHCYFDSESENTIVGYYDLAELKQKLSNTLIRRDKQEVIKQLPNISQVDIPVNLSAYQKKLHIKYAREVLEIFNKSIVSSFELQKSQQLIRNMRLLSDSSFLVDDTTNISPKLEELKHILSYKLHIRKSPRKVVIFTEWKKMLNIIARMLRLNKIGFVELTDETTEAMRSEAIRSFEKDEQCKILLATDKGSNGLNLKLADTIINFETPRTNHHKNLRMGRLDELGKRTDNLTIINLIAKDSLEEKIANGLKMDDIFPAAAPNEEKKTHVTEIPAVERSLYIEALSHTIEQMILKNDADEEEIKPSSGQMKLEFAEYEDADRTFQTQLIEETKKPDDADESTGVEIGHLDNHEIEDVLKSGVDFLSHLFKMSTGQHISIKQDQLHFDPESGEITLKFKVPKS